ncbi:MAG: hypothetical protein WC299_12650 [Kiritimatiellia bacterium]
MKKILALFVLAAFASATAVMAQEAAAEKKAEATKAPCVCCCDKCPMVAIKATKCCGQDMACKNVLAVKDGCAICCGCGADCKCTLKEGDETKCKCGKDVKKVSLKGMFVCEKDKVICNKEGKCSVCGGDLKAVKAEDTKPAPAPAQ